MKAHLKRLPLRTRVGIGFVIAAGVILFIELVRFYHPCVPSLRFCIEAHPWHPFPTILATVIATAGGVMIDLTITREVAGLVVNGAVQLVIAVRTGRTADKRKTDPEGVVFTEEIAVDPAAEAKAQEEADDRPR